MSYKNSQPMPALRALLPTLQSAQESFNSAPDSESSAARFNLVLEQAFHAMCLDMRGQDNSHCNGPMHNESTLQSLMKPTGPRSIWFRLSDPHATTERLTALAMTGAIEDFLKDWPGSPRDYLPASIQRTPDEQFNQRLEKSLRNGCEIKLGCIKIRLATRGDEWEDGDASLTALQDGVYLRLPAVDRSGTVVSHRWLHHGSAEHLRSIVEPYVQGLSAMDRELLMQQMTYSAAMRTFHLEDGVSRAGIPTPTMRSMGG